MATRLCRVGVDFYEGKSAREASALGHKVVYTNVNEEVFFTASFTVPALTLVSLLGFAMRIVFDVLRVITGSEMS